MLSIRNETPTDRDAVRRVIVEAFTHSELGHHGEADLVDQLRSHCNDLLALVAMEGEDLVGQILFSPVSIRTSTGVVRGMGLAPMAVVPCHQSSRIGSALVGAGLEHLSTGGCPFVVVLGHPQYYPRFGFQHGAEHGVRHGFAGIPQEVFFVKLLDQSLLESNLSGTAIYRSEFGPQDESPEVYTDGLK